jgi:hypothetical protein
MHPFDFDEKNLLWGGRKPGGKHSASAPVPLTTRWLWLLGIEVSITATKDAGLVIAVVQLCAEDSMSSTPEAIND